MPELASLSTTRAADALDAAAVAVLPTGSTEQHGPALPLGMDHLAAEAFADTVADRPDTIVLPTIPIGVSPHHMQFDGSLTVSDETFADFVEETVRSLGEHGLHKVVLVNGHGGNVGALGRAARSLRADEVAYTPTWNWWDAVGDVADELFDEAGGHADAAESSLIWHLHEALVDPDSLDDAETHGADGWGETVHGAQIGFDTVDFTESGAVGAPSQASPEAGATLFEAACEELDSLIDWLAERPMDECWQRAHR